MKNKFISLLPIEKAAAVYCALTCVLIAVMMPRLVDPVGMLLMRVEWLALTAAVIALSYYLTHSPRLKDLHYSIFNFQLSTFNLQLFIRVLVQMAWLPQWYPDIYEFNRHLQNLDHYFAAAEQWVFDCQPAIEFSQTFPEAFWSEAFNLGYFSYFPMIAALVITIFIQEFRNPSSLNPHPSTFLSVAATIQTAFFLYYFIYIFLPVTGPQYYFHAVGIDEILQGHFPAIGTYFSNHTEMLPPPGWSDGLFSRLVELGHETGERPAAAFPSSHVGISTIIIILARRHAPRLLPYLLPLWVLLCCSTVYIQAHYLIDSIAGLLSAPLALWLATRLSRKL
ncbi:MAG: phosphatase PAP2 family protein [Bacteroidaceae bacterium]|nr:phosphatase PAP2 family protein [Bacteroidaceae bacterium]